ncbi:MAG: PqqD family protein [Acidimicrobiales bacterium]|nr:PqqD family protein [Acidimicrobiales bacterium]
MTVPAGGLPSATSDLDVTLHRAAEHARPIRHPDVVTVRFGSDGSIVWARDHPPFVFPRLTATLWELLDGSVTLAELTTDIIEATGVGPETARRHVTSLALDLALNGLASGLDEVRSAWDALAPATDQRDYVESFEVVDGVKYLVTEFNLTKEESAAVSYGQASPLEMIPPTSCLGRKLQLDREAHLVRVPVGGRTNGVRTTDAEIAEWARRSTAVDRELERGPTVCYVTVDDAPGRPRRFGLYDEGGVLVASTVERDRIRDGISRLLLLHADLAPPPDHIELRVHALEKNGTVVLAPRSSLEQPRGMLRQLARHGISLIPAPRVYLDATSDHVAVPRADMTSLDDVTFDRFPVRGLWARGNRPEAELPMHEVALFARTSPGGDSDDRSSIVHAIRRLHGSVTVQREYRTTRSLPTLVGSIDAAFGTD